MTEPLAHLEMLLSNTIARIEHLNLERMKIDARMEELAKVRWDVHTALDEERAKLAASTGDVGT
jgi:hypothetical protein